jgi:hypothetical protein
MKQSETVPTPACFLRTEHKFKVFQNENMKEILIFGSNVLSYLGSLWEKGVEENTGKQPEHLCKYMNKFIVCTFYQSLSGRQYEGRPGWPRVYGAWEIVKMRNKLCSETLKRARFWGNNSKTDLQEMVWDTVMNI